MRMWDDKYQEIESIRMMEGKIGILCKRGITARKGVQLLKDNGITSLLIRGGIDELRNYLGGADEEVLG
jgi:rhodanese-related sulfurtransferase